MFDPLMMGSESCALDPFKANLRYALRGNSLADGQRPSVSDVGGVSIEALYPQGASGSTAWKYWPSYTSSMRNNDASFGLLSLTTNLPTALAALAARNSFSFMMRCNMQGFGPLMYLSRGSAGGWGGSGLYYHLSCYQTSGNNGKIRLAIDDGWYVDSVEMQITNSPLEIVTTQYFDGGNWWNYLFVNGVHMGNLNRANIAVLAFDGFSMTLMPTPMYLNDHFFWDACIARSSYTPAVYPFC